MTKGTFSSSAILPTAGYFSEAHFRMLHALYSLPAPVPPPPPLMPPAQPPPPLSQWLLLPPTDAAEAPEPEAEFCKQVHRRRRSGRAA